MYTKYMYAECVLDLPYPINSVYFNAAFQLTFCTCINDNTFMTIPMDRTASKVLRGYHDSKLIAFDECFM